MLRALKGHFILSLNDHPRVREIFAGFAIDALETTYTLAGGRAAKKVSEVLITNSS